jgi:hypothetical protein
VKTSPEDRVNLWQWVTFSFARPIMDLAMKKTLDEDDVWVCSLLRSTLRWLMYA